MQNTEPKQIQSDLDLNGFEKVFVQVTTSDSHEQSLNSNEHSLDIARQNEHVHLLAAESFELISMAEAARRLNMPYPTLRRHVLNGKIQSVTGQDGKLLVKIAKTEQASNAAEKTLNSNDHLLIPGEYFANIQNLLDELKTEREYSRALAAKLEAASHRNGYLEAQTESYQEQIKLLTDSQHKSGWWTRFCSWFMGRK